MILEPDLIDAMLTMHGVSGPWVPLCATGIANHIYATPDVVLRVATDQPDSVADARTESVAAPVAHAVGILTPGLIAFDDSRTLVDRPFSLWERVHGETLGLARLDRHQIAEAWREVGRELSRLHNRVKVCPDPNGYLDKPGRELDLHALLRLLVDVKRVGAAVAKDLAQLIDELRPQVAGSPNVRFVHNDIHEMNVMCSRTGALLALIDWGDAGWADPTLDFAAIPIAALPHALEGYESETPGTLGEFPEARFVWDKLHLAMEDASDGRGELPPLDSFRRFLRTNAD